MTDYFLAWHICTLCRNRDDLYKVTDSIYNRLSAKHGDVTKEETAAACFIRRPLYYLMCAADGNGEDIRRVYRDKYGVNVNFEISCVFTPPPYNNERSVNACAEDEPNPDTYAALINDLPEILKDRNDFIIMTDISGREQFRVTGYSDGFSLKCSGVTDAMMKNCRPQLEQALYSGGIAVKNLFADYDELTDLTRIREYAESHCEEIFARAANADKKVLTTFVPFLGIEEPSLIHYRTVSGSKKGKVIKKIPENGEYCEFLYNNGKLAAIRRFNSHGSESGYFFFDYDGFTWGAELINSRENMEYYGKIICGNYYRFGYDEKGRILSRYSISPMHCGCGGSLIGEDYEYPDDENMPIKCRYRHYVAGHSGSSKGIPAGYEHSPMREYYYEISRDLKVIRQYVRKKDEFVFCGEDVLTDRKTSVHAPADGTYEKLSAWLDGLLSDIPENARGLFLCLDEGTESGFGISPVFTPRFDETDGDWACDTVSSPHAFCVSVNGNLDWKDILRLSLSMLRKYFKDKDKKAAAKPLCGIGAGFADGDITVLYKTKAKH